MTAPAIPLSAEERAPSDAAGSAWVATVDHKRIGILYLWTALFFFLVGGCEALLMRLQLARAARSPAVAGGLQPDLHDARHDDDLPRRDAGAHRLRQLPRAADDRRARHGVPAPQRDGYWLFPFGGFLLHFSLLAGGAPNVGLVQLRARSARRLSPVAHGADYWVISLLVLGVGSVAAAINLIATILTLRAPGMTMRRVPLFVWMMFVNAILIVLALPALDRVVRAAPGRPPASTRTSSSRRPAARRSSGSTSSGPSGTPRSTSWCCRPSG